MCEKNHTTLFFCSILFIKTMCQTFSYYDLFFSFLKMTLFAHVFFDKSHYLMLVSLALLSPTGCFIDFFYFCCMMCENRLQPVPGSRTSSLGFTQILSPFRTKNILPAALANTGFGCHSVD